MNQLKKHMLAFVAMVVLGFAIAICLPVGCGSPEQSAYQATGVVTISVDAAMNGWGDYVRAGKASAGDEAKVKAAYERYQASIRTLRTAVLASVNAPDEQSILTTALNALDAAKIDLINLILSLKKG